MAMHEPRSENPAQLHLVGLEPAPAGGVGARQKAPRRRRRGGGYLNECTSPDVWE
jgi:hypothetical protein